MQNMQVRMCLNFGKFSQMRAMYVWPEIGMCGCAGVHVCPKICRNSQFITFQLENPIK